MTPPDTATPDTVPPHKQPHKLLMIPGPVEFDDDVLGAMATPATSHVAPNTIAAFGRSVKMLRDVVRSETAQPFILSGSGTLGWDLVASNLVERNDPVLILNTGYFGDHFGECFETYGATVDHLRPSVLGGRPTDAEIVTALKKKPYKAVTITHVDTSTGVLMDVQTIAPLIRSTLPDALIVVDGVCSLGAETIRMDQDQIDVVLSGSQKALGVPPGLCIFIASQRAMSRVSATPRMYYGSLQKWTKIMNAYEAGKPSYFATPAVQLIFALHTSLKKILEEGMEERFQKHKEVSKRFKETIMKWGLELVPTSPTHAANTLSAIYYPSCVTSPSDFLGKVSSKGVVLAGGLHPEIATKYFRVGHMHISTMRSEENGHIEKTLGAIESALKECGHTF